MHKLQRLLLAGTVLSGLAGLTPVAAASDVGAPVAAPLAAPLTLAQMLAQAPEAQERPGQPPRGAPGQPQRPGGAREGGPPAGAPPPGP
ncbi:hypothetical protein CH340_02685, partial [Rhodoplanes serenus]